MSRRTEERIEELARLLDGEVTERSTSEAQRLLVLANAVRDNAPELERPTPAFKAQLRAQLVQEAEAAQVGVVDRVGDAVRERTARWRASARVATATATAALMIGTAGAAVAAQSALPGELLYPLKQATESARLALAGSPEEVGRVQLDLARERLQELTEGVDSLSAGHVIDTLDAMDGHTEAGAEELLAAFDRTQSEPILEDLRIFTDEQRSGLTALLDELPLEAVPFADRSFELLRRIDLQSAISAVACDCGVNASAEGPAGAGSATGRGIAGPGEGPAAPACDCVEGDTPPVGRESGLLPDPGEVVVGEDGEPAASDEDPDGTGATIGNGESGLSEPVEELTDEVTDPLEELTEELSEPVEELTDEISEPVEELTEELTDPLEETTGGLTGSDGTSGSLVDDTVDTVEDTVDEVGDLLP